MIYVLDTHALTRYIENFPRLGATSRRILDTSEGPLYVPTITLAEARFLIAKGKVRIPWEDLIRAFARDERLVPFPLTIEVLDLLPDTLEMHDGIVVASALFLQSLSDDEKVAVITRDRQIRDSGLVPTVW